MHTSKVHAVAGGAIKGAVYLVAAAFPASLVMLLLLVVLGVLVSPFDGGGSLAFGAVTGVVAAPVWFVGALLVGGPIWALLHFTGHRNRRAALLAGALAAGVAVPLVFALILTGGAPQAFDRQAALILAALALTGAISGGVGGKTLWSMAYRGGAR